MSRNSAVGFDFPPLPLSSFRLGKTRDGVEELLYRLWNSLWNQSPFVFPFVAFAICLVYPLVLLDFVENLPSSPLPSSPLPSPLTSSSFPYF